MYIEKACINLCPFLYMVESFDMQLPYSIISPTISESPAYQHLSFDVSLLDMVIRHRGRRRWIDEVLRWHTSSGGGRKGWETLRVSSSRPRKIHRFPFNPVERKAGRIF
jgi:hypothetical protein